MAFDEVIKRPRGTVESNIHALYGGHRGDAHAVRDGPSGVADTQDASIAPVAALGPVEAPVGHRRVLDRISLAAVSGAAGGLTLGVVLALVQLALMGVLGP